MRTSSDGLTSVLVFAIALFYTILVLNNITDYGSNYEFVRHVLMMDSTLPGNRRRWPAAFVRLPIIPVCLPALLLRYPMCELDPPGRCGDIAAQQAGGNKKSDSDVKRTIQAARHGQLDQPQDKNDRDRRSPEGRKKGGVTGSKK